MIHRVMMTVCVCVICIIPLLATAGQKGQVKDDTSGPEKSEPKKVDKFRLDLLAADWPEWGKPVALELFTARLHCDEPGQSKLFELDDEVDMFASALLLLERPAAALEMYDLWYGASGTEHTPAAILTRARAWRLAAFQLLDGTSNPAEGQVIDRAGTFQKANILLTRALASLHSIRGTFAAIGSGGNSKKVGFVEWMELGLPRRASAKTPLRPEDRQPFPILQSLDYIKAYVEWEARIARELADVTYKETGSALSVNPNGQGAQSTAAAYYQHAREALFLARLFDADNKRLVLEADLLEERITWLRLGLPFGGQDFYRFDYYRPTNYLTHWRTKLDATLSNMDELDQRLGQQRQGAQQIEQTVAEQFKSRELLQQQFKIQMNLEMQSRLSGLKANLADLKTAKSLAALASARHATSTFISSSHFQLDADWYRKTLQRQELELQTRSRSLVGQLAQSGKLSDFRKVIAEGDLKDLSNVKQAFLAAFSEQELAGLLDSTLPLTSVTGVLEQKENLQRAAEIELEIARANRAYHEAQRDLVLTEAEIKVRQDAVNTVDNELATLRDPAVRRDEEKQRGVYRTLRDYVLPKIERELASARQHVESVRGAVKKFKEYVKETQKVIQGLKDAQQKVEQAYDAFKGLVVMFQATPATIVGPTGGSIVDPAQNNERTGRSMLDALQKKLDTLFKNHSFEQILKNLENEAETLEKSLDNALSVVDEKVATYTKLLDEKAGELRLGLPPETLIEEKLNMPLRNLGKSVLDGLQSRLEVFERDMRKTFSDSLLEREVNGVAQQMADKVREKRRLADQVVEDVKVKIASEAKSVWDRFEAAVNEEARRNKAEPAQYAAVYRQWALEKIELEEKKKLAEAELAAVYAAALADKQLIADHDAKDLELRVSSGEQRLQAARAEHNTAVAMQRAIWFQIVASSRESELISGQGGDIKSFQGAFETRLKELQATELVEEKNLTADQRSQDESVQAELSQLTAELNNLNSPKARLLTSEMLERLAPAVTAMRSSANVTVELRSLLENGNYQLLNYARWIYLLSGDARCLQFASRCDSLQELKLAAEALDQLHGGHRAPNGEYTGNSSKFGNPQVGALLIDIPTTQLGQNLSKSSLQVRLRLAQDNSKSKLAYLDATESAFRSDGKNSKLGMRYYKANQINERLFEARLNYHTRTSAIVCACVPIPEWTDQENVEFDLECLPIGHLVTPARGAYRKIPVWYPGIFNQVTASNQFLEAAAAGYLSNFLKESSHLLDNPSAAGGVGIESFGRGLEGVYSINFLAARDVVSEPADNPENPRANVLKSLKLLVIYLDRTNRPAERMLSDRPLALSQLKLNVLAKEPDQAAKKVVPDTVPLLVDAWVKPDSAKAFVKAWDAQPGPSGVQIQSAIKNQMQFVLSSQVDLARQGLIFRPVSLDSAVNVSRGVNQVVFKQVDKDYVQPLVKAGFVVSNYRKAGNRITRINNILAQENTRAMKLQSHVAKLRELRTVLNSEAITPNRAGDLKALLEDSSNARLRKTAARSLLAIDSKDGSEWKKHLLSRVVNQIQIAYANSLKTSPEGKSP